MPPSNSAVEPSTGGSTGKSKERTPQACQRCRSQKIRCDGFARAGGNCSPCMIAKSTCLYADKPVTTPRKTSPSKWYVESLEDRVEQLEAFITKLHPGETYPELGPPFKVGNWTKDASTTRDAHDDAEQDLDSLHNLVIDKGLDGDPRFYGNSSQVSFFMKKMMVRRVGKEGTTWPEWLHRVRSQHAGKKKMPEWQRSLFLPDRRDRLVFPPDVLLHELIRHYFENENVLIPVLHRPTFDAMVQSHLHERDLNFGAIVLMVCACGARWSEDSRAWASDSLHSAGWHYFGQVHRIQRPLAEAISLMRLQQFALMAVFLSEGSLLSLQWSILGMGLRYALDVGAHLRKTFSSVSKAERELWKRAFWALYSFDHGANFSLGRRPVILLEDIDQELPLEIDDEYWYHPDPREAFKQAEDVPCSISAFNAWIRLFCLLPKIASAVRYNSPETMDIANDHLADLDSALNEWLEGLPSHLRLDGLPSQDPKFFRQSTVLHTSYYMLIIFTHRSFISSPSDPVETDSPSLALCTNAARLCARTLHTFVQRFPKAVSPTFFVTALNAGMILMLNVWLSDRRSRSTMRTMSMENIQQCAEVLRLCSYRWPYAVQLGDIFEEMMRSGDVLSATSTSAPKRARPSDQDSATEDASKIPRVSEPTTTQEMLMPQSMLTPPEEITHRLAPTSVSVPTPKPAVGSSGPMVAALGPSDEWNGADGDSLGSYDDGQSFLERLLSTDVVLDRPPHVPIASSSNEEQNLLDISPEMWMEISWDYLLMAPSEQDHPTSYNL